MRKLMTRSALILGTAVALSAGLVPVTATPASALPAGYFYLLNAAQDRSGKWLAMDVHSTQGQFTGFVQLNPGVKGRASQQWKQRFPRNGPHGVIRLESRLLPGQCIADSTGSSSAGATVRPCSDPTTLWELRGSGSGTVLQRTQHVSAPFPDIRVCLGRRGTTEVETLVCTNGPYPEVSWRTTDGS